MTNKEAIEILKKKIVPCVKHSAWEEAVHMAIAALEKQEGKNPIIVETNIYDTEEIHHGCTVQILHNSVTGEVSVGWWEEREEE